MQLLLNRIPCRVDKTRARTRSEINIGTLTHLRSRRRAHHAPLRFRLSRGTFSQRRISQLFLSPPSSPLLLRIFLVIRVSVCLYIMDQYVVLNVFIYIYV